jgi:hypothetical protein
MSGQSLFLKSTESEGRSVQVDRFLAARGAGDGRLIFALDATASRAPTWELARGLTGDMIREAASVGSLSLQLVYFRGGSDGPKECFTSNWMSDPIRLAGIMADVECRAGYTQISRTLAHTRRETLKAKVAALVFVGDACELVDDNIDRLCSEAVELGKLKTPIFAFREGSDVTAEGAFRKIASLSGGAYGRFDSGAAKQLGELLKAVALFAVGGKVALEGRKDAASMLLLGQMKR